MDDTRNTEKLRSVGGDSRSSITPRHDSGKRTNCAVGLLFTAAAILSFAAGAQTPQPISVPTLNLAEPFLPFAHYGPYSSHILAGGRGLTKSLPAKDPILKPSTPWTISAWVEFAPISPATVLIAGVGDPTGEDFRFLALVDGKPALRMGSGQMLASDAPFAAKGWHYFAATFDGATARFYVDGRREPQVDCGQPMSHRSS